MTQFAQSFGHKMYCAHFAVRGTILKEACEVLAKDIINLIGMTPRKVFVDDFSDVEEVGVTYFHSLLESYIAIDTYAPRFAGAYIQVCSCKPFSAESVQEFLGEQGLELMDAKVYELGV